MQTPNTPFVGDEAQARHQAYIQAAEQWRVQQAVRATIPTRRRSARVSIAQRMSHWGKRLLESGRPAVPAEEIW
jgi:hypothetical protein